jgi:23S rRNA pseudouridine1911/1915/1917 synthase
MPNDFTLSIPPDLDGAALGSALKQMLPNLSWSQVKGLIQRRHVEVNGTLALEEGRRVRAGDVVDVYECPRAAPPGERDVSILFADEHLAVVEKPAGIVTQRHPAERDWDAQRKAKQPSLEEVVQRLIDDRWRAARGGAQGSTAGSGRAPFSRDPKGSASRSHATPQRRSPRHPLDRSAWGPVHPLSRSESVGKGRKKSPQHPPAQPASRPSDDRPPRVRAVHRLDRDTSGLMLFALSPDAEESLVRMFKTHAIERNYLGVVHGHPAEQTIESWFVRDRGDGLRGSSPSAVGAQYAERAVTHVKPVERVGPYSLVECRLETGRTHQIRIHLTEIGHMLCGERVYTHRPGEPPQTDDSAAPRQALHSSELRFVHPITGNRTQFRSPLPADLDRWLGELKRKYG